ncbi:adenylate kinase [Longimicrobium sp.]|uniref:adenylate kinase n=1 Tax=Longimicrobium sp. TaxID=2029185 RepID=UPI002E301459|nr:adenylate kinase [Longimicrobium sp.]HEX6039923.1 adenylate kinase [Longimicrobium sp.]
MDLVLLGAPGAGKGTQGALLADALGVPKIATGDMLRDAVRQGTELGLKAKAIMDAGHLVSDDIVLGLVRERLAGDGANGAIFDGYPRNVAQAQSLDGLLGELGRRIGAVVYIDVDDDAIVQRMSGRTTDPVTGVVYHHTHNPPPSDIAARCVQRDDDREETVRHRLEVYRQSTAPLVDHYRQAGVAVHTVDGTRAIPEVQAEILGLLGR